MQEKNIVTTAMVWTGLVLLFGTNLSGALDFLQQIVNHGGYTAPPLVPAKKPGDNTEPPTGGGTPQPSAPPAGHPWYWYLDPRNWPGAGFLSPDNLPSGGGSPGVPPVPALPPMVPASYTTPPQSSVTTIL